MASVWREFKRRNAVLDEPRFEEVLGGLWSE